MNMSGRLTALVLLLSGSLFASVRVLENSPTRLTFRWDMGGFDTTTQLDSGKLSTVVSFTGENIALGEMGEPVIPGMSLYAGIPAAGTVRVSFSPGATHTLTLHHPLKIQRRVRGEAALPPSQRDLSFPEPWISAPRYTAFGSLRAAHLVLRPVRYEAGSNTLQLLETGECTIEFPPAPPSVAAATSAASDYQRMLKGLLLNYDVARTWAKAPARRSLHKVASATGSDPFPLSYGQQVFAFTIGDGHGGMNEVTVKENGVVKITGAQILRLFGRSAGTLSMSALALYGSVKGELPLRAPDIGAIPAGIAEVPLLRVDRNHDGLVDADDFVLAYVTGLNDWVYDSVQHDFVYVTDDFDDYRHYFLTLKQSGAGASMARFTQPPAAVGVDTLDSFLNRAMFKELLSRPALVNNCIPEDQDGLGWVWQRVAPNGSFECPLGLADLDTSQSGTLRFSSFFSMPSSVSATISGAPLCTECADNTDYPIEHWGNRLVYARNGTSGCDYWQLEHMEVRYHTKLSAALDTLRMQVFSSTDSLATSYRLSGMGGLAVYVFRIPNDESAMSLIDSVSGKNSMVWSDSGRSGARYFLCSESGLTTIPDNGFSPLPQPSSSGYVMSNLREVNNETDYLIVAPPSFFDEAKKLAGHKAKHGFGKPAVVSINDVYTYFSGGNTDPSALRNFLAYVKRDWKNGTGLQYVLFMGAGHYDFKQVKTTEVNYIPPSEQDNLCLEDFYATLAPADSASELSLALGRLPCKNESEAATMVDKIIEVEDAQQADWSAWRNTMLFVADDDMQGTTPDGINGNANGHHASSERTAALVESLRPSMDLRKVYLFEYPWNANLEKPEASRAIVNAINSGVGYVNFFGHGSPEVWTDEHVLTLNTIPQLNNEKRYPLISSFSCSVGKFDAPNATSLSEALVKAPHAGAIATFSADRLATATSNEELAQNVYSSLFDTLSSTSVGMAILRAKAQNHDANNLVYALLGDPSLRLVTPARKVLLEIDTAQGRASDTLKALQQITIKGSVVDETGAADKSFGASAPAYVQMSIFNPPELTTRKDNGKDTSVRYTLPGAPLFSGKVAVQNGAFSQSAILPLSVAMDMSGSKLIAYAYEGQTAALGSREALYFHGSKPRSHDDTTGPRITIRPVYDAKAMSTGAVSFTDRITSSLPFSCEFDLYDPSGVNVTNSGPDEGLTMEVPGVISRRNINHLFQFVEGDFRRGSAAVSFETGSLKSGHHDLVLTAQDLLGNVTRTTFALEITDENALTLDHVFNAPNPMRMGEATRFYFYPSNTTVDIGAGAVIKIYSLAGRLLRVMQGARNGEAWDGRDQTGYPLPPAIYLFQVSVDAQDKHVKSKIQKLVIHPPR